MAVGKEKLQSLSKLVGTWKIEGQKVKGIQQMEWMEGRHFLIQHFDIVYEKRSISGLEIIEYDEDSDMCMSHLYDNEGNHFIYYYDVNGAKVTVWHGDVGSDNYFEGEMSEDLNSYIGSWYWPGGGYDLTATKINQ